MQKRSRRLFLFVLLVLPVLFFSCQTSQDPDMVYSGPLTLKLIETTDIHGSIFPYDFINDEPADTSLAQLLSYVNTERAKEDQEVILLDNGDILQGQPVVYYSNFEAVDEPHIASLVMNYAGYDASVVGNHDVEAGHPVYDKLVKEFNFPWLAANIIDTETGEPYFEPYTVIWRGGAKIVVFGICTPGVPTWLPEDLWEGMEFRGMVETAAEWVPKIKEQEDPDLLIGLFHAGTDYTYNDYTADDRLNPNASELVAARVPGFDIIFTGHDHQTHNYTVEDPEGNEVLVIGATNAGRTAAAVTVTMSRDDQTGEWSKEITGEIIEGTDLPPDAAFMSQFAPVQQEVKDYVAKPIGAFTKTISTRESMFGDSPFVDLIHRIQLEITDADVSFAAPLSFSAEISAGDIYVRDMFNLYKYENLLYTMNLTGSQIKGFLEYSYEKWFSTMTGPDDRLINFKRDADGNMIWNERYSSYDTATRYYNYDSAAGIDYVVDVSKPAGSRVTIQGFSDGRAFEPGTTYLVAINSYRASGGGGHITRGAGIAEEDLESIMVSSTIKDLRYYLMKWIEEQGTVTPSSLGNWSVVPDDWWKAAKEIDYRILYEGLRVD